MSAPTKPCECCGYSTFVQANSEPFICNRCHMIWHGIDHRDGSPATSDPEEIKRVSERMEELHEALQA